MRVLARLFSGLTLVVLLASAGALFYFKGTPPLPDLPPIAGTADRIIIDKSARTLTLLRDG